MVDPTRKRRKGRAEPSLQVVREISPTAWQRIVSTHPTRPGVLDLVEFSDGTMDKETNNSSWSGGFSGRPHLIRELEPALRWMLQKSPESTIDNARGVLRKWWRLFDETQHLANVQRLEDIADIHGSEQARRGFSDGARNTFLRAVNQARKLRQLPPLYFPTADVPQRQSNLPDPRAVRAVYHHLKSKVRGAIDRWSRADELARSGRDWSKDANERPLRTIWKESEIHATYRGLLRGMQYPCPSMTAVQNGIGIKNCKGFENMSLPAHGLYPSKADLQAFLFLFLLRTGWNTQTALNLDVTSAWLQAHPTSAAHQIVRSIKTRGNTEQVAIGLAKSDTSPGRLIGQLIERTKPLREHLARQLLVVKAKLEDAPDDETLRLKHAALLAGVRSPWLFCDVARGGVISVLTDKNVFNASAGVGAFRTWIRELNKKAVLSAAAAGVAPYLVPETLLVSDLRDAYVAFAYERSGFNWLVAKLAAGHSSIESLKRYLRQRQWKTHGEGQVIRFTEALWSEIRERRIVDPAILRALVNRGAISEEQRTRWQEHKDRTRVGTGCADFRRPPRDIAPQHQEGTGCRVQRCTLCPHAIVFADSVAHIARRLAEVEHLKANLPLAAWHESRFEEELEATEKTLKLFDPALVESHVVIWRAAIDSGEHRVLQFEGEYA